MNAKNVILNADESCVLRFLKNWPDSFVSDMEIARRADGKSRFSEDPAWADYALGQLLELDLVERDRHGRFRVKPRSSRKCKNKRRFVAPQLHETLRQAGYCMDCFDKNCTAHEA